MRPTDGGANFGWRVFEGTQVFSGPAIRCRPVAEYRHGTGPTGQFGDRRLCLSRPEAPCAANILRRLRQRQSLVVPDRAGQPRRDPAGRAVHRSGAPSFAPTQGTIDNISSFGVDQQGNLYIVDFDGEIFRIELA